MQISDTQYSVYAPTHLSTIWDTCVQAIYFTMDEKDCKFVITVKRIVGLFPTVNTTLVYPMLDRALDLSQGEHWHFTLKGL